jgi:hypothetical protein
LDSFAFEKTRSQGDIPQGRRPRNTDANQLFVFKFYRFWVKIFPPRVMQIINLHQREGREPSHRCDGHVAHLAPIVLAGVNGCCSLQIEQLKKYH